MWRSNHTNSRSTETAGCSSKNLTSLPSKIFNVHKLINPCIVKLGCRRHFFGLIVGCHFSFYKIEPRSQVRSQVISHLTSGESVCRLFPPLLISTLLYTGIYQLSCELTVSQSDGLAQRQLVSIGFDGVRLPTFPPPSQELYYAVYLPSLSQTDTQPVRWTLASATRPHRIRWSPFADNLHPLFNSTLLYHY